MKEIKPKKCAVCREDFIPFRTTQKVCGPTCAISLGKSNIQKKNAREWQKEKKIIKEKMKTQSGWLKDLQVVFNEYIRLSQKGSKCISCQNPNPTDAGHYRSIGAHPELRFEEKNVNLQCRKCNGYWGGNLIEYRKGLIKKYGVEIVEWLEGPHKETKLSIPEIKMKIEYYREKIREMKKGIAV
ncbi:recombination protein NinG [Chryseobacterium sp. MHB01]|uniref:recombination protein NinG n=1 Tax=Chryseobacterium sp. MHB01 TaxID=3109433 RepID=UPI002AFF1BEB|nr:recombination protein NinG [Chryseobacterium sp. MHB01]MEA1849169.1 recombination protein NinG [Chryseobacterium sp. MHB01]